MKEKTNDKNRIFESKSVKQLKERSKDGLFRELFSDWKWIFVYIKKHIRLLFLYLIAGIFANTMSLAYSYSIKMLINQIIGKEYRNILILALVLVCSIVVSILLRAVSTRISAKISVCVNNDIQDKLFDRILDAKWEDFNQYQTGDMVNRFNDDVKTISQNAVSWIPDMLINLYTFCLTFIILWRIDFVMALISVLAAPVLLLVSRVLLKHLHEKRKQVSELNSDMISFETDTLNNFEMIKSFGIRDFYQSQMDVWHGKYKDSNLGYNKVEIKSRLIMSLTSSFITLTALGYCLFRLSKGTLLYGDMTFFLTQRSNVSNRFNSLVTAIPGLLNSAVAAGRVRELIELAPEQHNETDLAELSESKGITVKLNNVAFSYNENAQIYKGGDFIARPGEIVTILGSSGEGKTTLLRMILGLISPDSGDVTLIGSDGKEMPVNADLRKLISYVPQGNTTITGTISENMRMVKENATDEEITEALKTACAWDFVKELPDGINTHLGGNAHGISTGQAQRISIARAVLRNSPILMLDEATSALDINTENTVLKNIVSMCPDKTCIVSTHRPSILKLSNRVYRVEDKKLVVVDTVS